MILSSLFSVSIYFSLNATILYCANDQTNPHTHTYYYIYNSRISSNIYSSIKHKKSVTIETFFEQKKVETLSIFVYILCKRRVKARK